jgi:hypothetical protein
MVRPLARSASFEVAHFSAPSGRETNHENPKGRKPESKTRIFATRIWVDRKMEVLLIFLSMIFLSNIVLPCRGWDEAMPDYPQPATSLCFSGFRPFGLSGLPDFHAKASARAQLQNWRVGPVCPDS